MGILDSLPFKKQQESDLQGEKKIKKKKEDFVHFSSGQQYQMIVVHSKY